MARCAECSESLKQPALRGLPGVGLSAGDLSDSEGNCPACLTSRTEGADADREHESAATSSENKHISNKRVSASLFFSSDRAGQNLEKK